MPKTPEDLVNHELSGYLRNVLTAVDEFAPDEIDADQAFEDRDIEELYSCLEPVDNLPVAQDSLDKSKTVLDYLRDYKSLFEDAGSDQEVNTKSVNTNDLLEVADFYRGEVDGPTDEYDIEGSLAYGILASTFFKNIPDYNEGAYEPVNIEVFKDGQSVYIEIVDDGVGLEDTKGITEGDGGLSTSEWIINQYGGELKVGEEELEGDHQGYEGFGVQAELPAA